MANLNKSLFTSKHITNKSVSPSLQDVLDSTPALGGYRDITVVTAGDDSHTLTESDAGVVNISAALADGAVIKLPAATANLVGWHTKILFTGKMAAAASIRLPNGGTGNFVGVIEVQRGGDGTSFAGNAPAATAVERVPVIPGAGAQQIALDENDETFGGAIGSVLDFFYASTTEVVVTGTLNVNKDSTAIDALTATTFTATGY
tara:strand:- start:135 stop:746 length:612 start_codon:yes stop_codon:yes gene_type:complete